MDVSLDETVEEREQVAESIDEAHGIFNDSWARVVSCVKLLSFDGGYDRRRIL